MLNINLFIILHIITHHILFVILELTITPIINPNTGTINYVVNENAGNVTVCLMKDLVTDDDFSVTFIAQEKTPSDALCKISENRIIKYYIQHNYNEILYIYIYNYNIYYIYIYIYIICYTIYLFILYTVHTVF